MGAAPEDRGVVGETGAPHPEPVVAGRRRRRGLGLLAAVVALTLGAWALSRRDPAWWRPPDLHSLRADAHARALEQGLASEFTRIREAGEPWAIRIRAEDANAWLALRLPGWLEHDRELPWPRGVELVQVRFSTPDRFTVGARRGGSIWSATLRVALDHGRLSFTPISGAVGSLWVPWSIASSIDQGAPGIEAFLPELIRPVEAELPIPDGRRIRLLDFEFDEGAVLLRLQTLPR